MFTSKNTASSNQPNNYNANSNNNNAIGAKSASGVNILDIVIKRSIENLLKLAKIQKKYQQIVDACTKALEQIQATTNTRGAPGDQLNIEQYFAPLKLACESKNPKMMQMSLDCLQKLIEHGCIEGQITQPETSQSANAKQPRVQKVPLIDVVIHTICNCLQDVQAQSSDEQSIFSVELQIIKALLSAISSPKCNVHGKSLVLAINTLIIIQVITRNNVNKKAAEGSLNQMLSHIFLRMETSARLNSSVSVQQLSAMGIKSSGSISDLLNPRASVPTSSSEGEASSFTNAGEDAHQIPEEKAAEVTKDLANNNNNNNATASAAPEQPPQSAPQPETKQQVAAPATADDFSHIAPIPREEPLELKVIDSDFENEFQFDAFLVLRELCLRAVQPLVDENTTFNEQTAQSRASRRTLCMELLVSILKTHASASVTIKTNPAFISATKYICRVVIPKNLVSNLPNKLFELALSLFVAIISIPSNKPNIKTELGIIMKNIFFRILKSPYSSLEHKTSVARVLHTMCQDPQTVIDLYVNYDCDSNFPNVFENMMHVLSKVAQKPYSFSGDPVSYSQMAQETSLKFLCLASLVLTSRSMVEWTQRDPTALADNKEKAAEELKLVEQHRQQKKEFETALEKFNKDKAKRGIQYLIQRGLLQQNPEDVALFISTTEHLNKKSLGEYLGERDDFNIKVLTAYAYLVDLTGLDFNAALRYFLSGFRLPGESAQIERIMERFAKSFCRCNPGIFSSPDTAFVLAYSCMILHSDQHNVNVNKKHRMTAEDFVKTNRGIDGGKDLPREMLLDLYEKISKEEIILDDEAEGRAAKGQEAALQMSEGDPRKKQLLYETESQNMIKHTSKLLSKKARISDRIHDYIFALCTEHAGPMFEVAATHTLAAIANTMQSTDDPRLIQLCLEGFEFGVRISSVFSLTAQRNAYVSALTKFTYLNSVPEIKQKNIDCIKKMIKIANVEGNYLGESWTEILKCISQLERLHLIGIGAKSDLNLVDANGAPRSRKSVTHNAQTTQQAIIEEVSQTIIDQIDSVVIDKIFSSSVHLNNEAIVHFVKSMCEVSLEEIKTSPQGTPRMFTLQKLVEVSHINMLVRDIKTFLQIWSHISSHLSTVGCHPNISVSMTVIDSLRQISLKYLEKEHEIFKTNGHDAADTTEEEHNFQRYLLKPFEIIMTNSNAISQEPNNTNGNEIKELILRCIAQIILMHAENIKSGWKSVMMVFYIAAKDANGKDNIATFSFKSVESIVKEEPIFLLVPHENFTDIIKCLFAFAKNKKVDAERIGLTSIDYVRLCAQRLVEGKVQFGTEPMVQPPSAMVFTDDKNYLAKWLPILMGLSHLVSNDERLPIRLQAFDTLFDILTSYGKMFSESFWRVVFVNVLIPIFDNALVTTPTRQQQQPAAEKPAALSRTALKFRADWMKSMCRRVVEAIVDLFSQFYSTHVHFLLPQVLALLCKFVELEESETVSDIGISNLVSLVKKNGPTKFTSEVWFQITETFQRLMLSEQTVPTVGAFTALLSSTQTQSAPQANKADSTSSTSSAPRANRTASMATPPTSATPQVTDRVEAPLTARPSTRPAAPTAQQQQQHQQQHQHQHQHQHHHHHPIAASVQQSLNLNVRCASQLLCIRAIGEVVMTNLDLMMLNSNSDNNKAATAATTTTTTMEIAHIQHLLSTLEQAYENAKRIVNEVTDQQKMSLLRTGNESLLRHTFDQITQSLSALLSIVFRMFAGQLGERDTTTAVAAHYSLLKRLCHEVFYRYLLKSSLLPHQTSPSPSSSSSSPPPSPPSETTRSTTTTTSSSSSSSLDINNSSIVVPKNMLETTALVPVIILILDSFASDALTDSLFSEYIVDEFYEELSTLVLSNHPEVRLSLKRVFDKIQLAILEPLLSTNGNDNNQQRQQQQQQQQQQQHEPASEETAITITTATTATTNLEAASASVEEDTTATGLLSDGDGDGDGDGFEIISNNGEMNDVLSGDDLEEEEEVKEEEEEEKGDLH